MSSEVNRFADTPLVYVWAEQQPQAESRSSMPRRLSWDEDEMGLRVVVPS